MSEGWYALTTIFACHYKSWVGKLSVLYRLQYAYFFLLNLQKSSLMNRKRGPFLTPNPL